MSNKEPQCNEGELPEGWALVSLSHVVEFRKGKKPNELRNEPSDGFVPYLDIQAIQEQNIRQYADAASSRLSQQSDVLVVWDGARSGLAGMAVAGAIGSTIMALTSKELDSAFLLHFIVSQYDTINSNTRGTGIPHVDPELFWNLGIPVPPLAEQRRIVSKLEEVLEKVQQSQQRLARIPALLKRFRQSVLAAACSGKLTASWRAQRSNAIKDAASGVDDSNQFYEELPKTWTQTSLRPLIKLVTSGSRGWAAYYSNTGSLFIRAQNINSDVLRLDDVAFVALPNKAEGLRTRVQKYDLLITITGANVTKAALVETDIGDAYVSQHVALLRLVDESLSKFVYLWIVSSGHGRKQLLESAYGQGKPGLNLDNIRDLAIAIPPLLEQQEIVRLVEQLFAFADQIEGRFKKAQSQVDQLTQSVLAKAFRGNLVPTEAELARLEKRFYEPASELLARIEMTQLAPSGGSKRKTKPVAAKQASND